MRATSSPASRDRRPLRSMGLLETGSATASSAASRSIPGTSACVRVGCSCRCWIGRPLGCRCLRRRSPAPRRSWTGARSSAGGCPKVSSHRHADSLPASQPVAATQGHGAQRRRRAGLQSLLIVGLLYQRRKHRRPRSRAGGARRSYAKARSGCSSPPRPRTSVSGFGPHAERHLGDRQLARLVRVREVGAAGPEWLFAPSVSRRPRNGPMHTGEPARERRPLRNGLSRETA